MRRNWTEEEEQILIDLYSIAGPKALAERLNRNMKSVSKKAIKLGLSRGVAASNYARRNAWQFTEWSYDLGYIVGVYLGDGNIYIKEGQVAYFRHCSIDKDFCEAVRHKLKKLTGYTGTIKWNKNKQQYIFTLANIDFARWLENNFGGPKRKQIKVLSTIEANKGMVEGIFDSEGTVTKYSFIVRMQDNPGPLKWVLFEQLGVVPGPLNKSGRKLEYNHLYSLTVSNKEYTRIGLGTYIKRKAKHGVVYKPCDYSERCRNDGQ